MGHSAEALEVFTTLEQFCHNMPSNYCNDDYYKGILRSKTGVFNSYLAVAEAALRRGNADMARLFWEYALQYKETNEGEILDEAALLAVEEELRRLHTSSTSAPQKPQPVEPEPRREESNAPTPQEPQSVESEPRRESAPQEPHSVEAEPRSDASRESALQKERELNLECERLLVEGIDYCYKEEYEKAFEVLSKAKVIGTCGGEILDKLLRSLKQILED